MAETEHPLLQLSPEKQSQLVDLVENGEIDAISEATGLSRRQILQVGAALGVGSVAGGLSASELVRKVRADASTSDGDGNVGLPGDRVDVFAEGVDANSVNTGEERIGSTSSPLSIEQKTATLDGTDSTTWVNVGDSSRDIARAAAIVMGHVPGNPSTDGVEIFLGNADFGSQSGTVLDSKGLEFRTRDSSLEVRTSNTGLEGSTVYVTLLKMM